MSEIKELFCMATYTNIGFASSNEHDLEGGKKIIRHWFVSTSVWQWNKQNAWSKRKISLWSVVTMELLPAAEVFSRSIAVCIYGLLPTQFIFKAFRISWHWSRFISGLRLFGEPLSELPLDNVTDILLQTQESPCETSRPLEKVLLFHNHAQSVITCRCIT